MCPVKSEGVGSLTLSFQEELPFDHSARTRASIPIDTLDGLSIFPIGSNLSFEPLGSNGRGSQSSQDIQLHQSECDLLAPPFERSPER